MATAAPSLASRIAMARPMPREAPVTSAVFPSKSILANLIEIVKCFLQRLDILHIQALEGTVNSLVEAAERLARSCFDKSICAEFLHSAYAVFPFHRAGCLLYQAF